MSKIFISYASNDRKEAQFLAATLERYGWSVWWDHEIPIGRTFDEAIEEELDVAECIIVLWSKHSVLSQWVKAEAAEGRARNILIPVLIDDVKVPLEFRRIQTARLIGWQGDSTPEFTRLLQAIARISFPETSKHIEDAENNIPAGDVNEQESSQHNAKLISREVEAGKRHLHDSLAGTIWVYRWRDRDFEFGFGKSGDLQILQSWKGVRWRVIGPTTLMFDAPNGEHMLLQLDETLRTFTTYDWDGQIATGRRTNKKLI